MARVLLINPPTKGESMAKRKHALRYIETGRKLKGHMYLGSPNPGLLGMLKSNPVTGMLGKIEHPLHKDVPMALLTGALGAYLTKAIPTRKWLGKITDKIPYAGKYLGLLVGNGLNMTVVSSVVKYIPGTKQAYKGIMTGGLVITGYEFLNMLLSDIFPAIAQSGAVAGLGDNKELRKAIQAKVLKQLQSGTVGQPKSNPIYAMGQPKSNPIYATKIGQPQSDPAYMIGERGGDSLMGTEL